MTFAIRLPYLLLGNRMNKGILVKTYGLFWNVNRKQVEIIVICGRDLG